MGTILIDINGNVLNENELEENGEILSALEVIDMFKNREITLEELIESCPEVKIVKKEIHSNHSKTPSKKHRTGKLYAIGDIHGKWKAYQTAMERTLPEDRVVILGDVIDRGSDGIKILQDIMKRKNVEFILGNHEYMMIEALNVIREYNLSKSDCIKVLEPYYSFKMKMNNMKLEAIQRKTSELEKAGVKDGFKNIQGKIKEQGKVYEAKKIQSIGVWLSTANGGKPTLLSILRLPENEQKQIYDYLCNSYIMLCERTKEQDILFVHAQPSQDLNSIKRIHSNYSGIKYSEMSRQDIYPMVWNRRKQDGENTYIKCKEEGLLTICGHEPEHANIVQNWDNGYICIDAGSGHGGRVALYDVENDSLELIFEDGTIDNKKMNIRIWN